MIQWSDDLTTGIDAVDSQHREIFRRAGNLSAAISAHRGAEEIVDLLAFLEDYTVNHFRDEEAIFPETGYSGADEHRRQHRECVEEVGRLKSGQQEKGSVEVVAIALLGFLTRWLIRHIRLIDGELGPLLRQGVATSPSKAFH